MNITIELSDLSDIFYPIIMMDKDFDFNKLVEFNNQLIEAVDNDVNKINSSYYYKLGVFVYHQIQSILNKLYEDYSYNQSYVIKEAIWLFFKADYSEKDLIDIGKTAEWCIKTKNIA